MIKTAGVRSVQHVFDASRQRAPTGRAAFGVADKPLGVTIWREGSYKRRIGANIPLPCPVSRSTLPIGAEPPLEWQFLRGRDVL